jgi:hypothetical protein
MAGVDSPRSLSKDEDMHVEKTATAESQYEIDPDIDRRVTRKFDLHILPFLFGIWLFAFIGQSPPASRSSFIHGDPSLSAWYYAKTL